MAKDVINHTLAIGGGTIAVGTGTGSDPFGPELADFLNETAARIGVSAGAAVADGDIQFNIREKTLVKGEQGASAENYVVKTFIVKIYDRIGTTVVVP